MEVIKDNCRAHFSNFPPPSSNVVNRNPLSSVSMDVYVQSCDFMRPSIAEGISDVLKIYEVIGSALPGINRGIFLTR